MITNFKEYKEMYFSKENNLYSHDFIDNLSVQEIESLKNEVNSWTVQQLKVGHEVLEDYFGMKVPESLLKEVCSKDLTLAYEIFTKGVDDTCQRDKLANSVLSKINMRSWPTYREGEEAYNEFQLQLKEKAEKFGIVITENFNE